MIHLLGAAQPRDRHGPVGPAPIEGHRRTAPRAPLADGRHGLPQLSDARPQAAKQGPPGPAGGLGGVEVVAAEQPQGQGAVGDQLDPQLPADGRHPAGFDRLRRQQRQLHLQAGDRHPLVGQAPVHLPQPLRPHVGHPQAGHGPLAHQIRQAIQQRALLPGGVAGGAPVQLHPLQPPLQPCPGGGEGAPVPLATQPPREGGQLGGDAEALLLRRAGRGGELAQQGFAAAVEAAGAVGVGRVEEQQIPLQAAGKGGRQALVVALRRIAPEELVAPGPGAHADAGLVAGACHDRCHSAHHSGEFSALLRQR